MDWCRTLDDDDDTDMSADDDLCETVSIKQVYTKLK